MTPNPPNPLFSKCVICDNPISNHSDMMINECYEKLRGVLSK